MEAVRVLAAPVPASLSLGARAQFMRLPRTAARVARGAALRCRVVASAKPSYAGEGDALTVFPGEACDELGGEFCNAEGVGPEVKVASNGSSSSGAQSLKGLLDAFKPEVGTVDYEGPKTVFPGEACDELGGEFCEPDYQKGVGKEVKQ